MRAVTVPGRWAWGLSGLVTAAILAVYGVGLITSAGATSGPPPQATATRTATLLSPVTSLTVQSYGAPVQVTTRSLRRVQVRETLTYDPKAGPPAVTQSLSGGHLILADPACSQILDCTVSFALAVPPGVTVTAVTEGGALTISGTAGASLDSGGGPVQATRIGGPLTVSTSGGSLLLNGLTGALYADTGGGTVVAQGVDAATATVITGGGDAHVGFSAAPEQVMVSTEGGLVALTVPGGPYVLTADSDGGPEWAGIATSPAAHRSITASSGGGSLRIGP